MFPTARRIEGDVGEGCYPLQGEYGGKMLPTARRIEEDVGGNMLPTARRIEGDMGERCCPRQGELREIWGKDVTHGKEN